MPDKNSNLAIARLSHVTLLVAIVVLATPATPAMAGPTMPAGDSLLRHDVQLLSDYGIIRGPVSTWPLAWGPVLAGLNNFDGPPPNAAVAASIVRLRERASWETRVGELTFQAHASAAEAPAVIRGFEDTPRGNAEVGGGFAWTGNRFAVSLNAQLIDRTQGDVDARLDGSQFGIAIGNYSLSLNSLNRWWGPGWDGSLILSNNARPIPAVSLDRIFTDGFESRWLKWLGPWDMNVTLGELESSREVPNALIFGFRFNFKPTRSLEIGISRTAQWCGDNRPCDGSTFLDLLLGRDNTDGDGIDANNEPGNQLAGVDFRWSKPFGGMVAAFYGQLIGEDEAGGFPSRYLGQFGIEASGTWRDLWSWRWNAEFAGTSCQFHESTERFNCAYNHGVYQTGYRYRGRPIGHGVDNDARIISTGLLAADNSGQQWRILLRAGTLNRGGTPDSRNTLTATPSDLQSFDVSYSRTFEVGVVEVGAGFENTDSSFIGNHHDSRFYLQWRSAY